MISPAQKQNSTPAICVSGSMFVAPNPIDFNKVFNANLAENPVALAAVCGIFGVYLILAIYARREDLKDVVKVLMFTLILCYRSSFV